MVPSPRRVRRELPLTPTSLAEQFNEAINARALDDLAALMTTDHRFIDAAGTSTNGKLACVQAWRTFFDAFPDYQNVFHDVTSFGNVVVVRGCSRCSTAALDGPALWSARIDHGAVSEWRVYDDTPENREVLGTC